MLTLLALNVPLMVVFLGLWAGIPVWLTLKYRDERRRLVPVPVIRNVPSPRTEPRGYQRVR
jgi:hypothetical protein